MEIVKHFLDFISDKSKRWTSKALVTFSILMALLILNDFTGFTYHYSIQNKLGTIKNINELLKDSNNLPQNTKNYLLQLREETIYRNSVCENIILFFQKKVESTMDNSSNPEITNLDRRTPTLMYISSSFFFILIALISIITLFTDKSSSFLPTLATISIAVTIVLSVGFLMTYFLWKIPLLNVNPWWNYGLNFLLHTLFVILMSYSYKYMKQKL